MLFFFFQAEDGIRDLTVTGVQTCALPICPRRRGHVSRTQSKTLKHGKDRAGDRRTGKHGRWRDRLRRQRPNARRRSRRRSEERRVGKECRSRWSPEHQKKKHATYEITMSR